MPVIYRHPKLLNKVSFSFHFQFLRDVYTIGSIMGITKLSYGIKEDLKEFKNEKIIKN